MERKAPKSCIQTHLSTVTNGASPPAPSLLLYITGAVLCLNMEDQCNLMQDSGAFCPPCALDCNVSHPDHWQCWPQATHLVCVGGNFPCPQGNTQPWQVNTSTLLRTEHLAYIVAFSTCCIPVNDCSIVIPTGFNGPDPRGKFI